MSGSATFTIVMSSSSMKIERHTTRSVHHLEAMGPHGTRGGSDTMRSMFGGSSIQLGRVFGIRIGVDLSWFIVLFLIIWQLSGYYEDVARASNAFGLAVISALLCCRSILLHELGHAWVAIRN